MCLKTCVYGMHTHTCAIYMPCMNSVSVVVKNVIKKGDDEEEEDLMEAVVVVMMTIE